MKKQKFLEVGIVILSVLAFFLGFLIYKTQNYTLKIKPYFQKFSKTPSPSPNQVLSPLDTPKQDDPEGIKIAYAKLISENVKIVDYLDIKSCQPSNLVTRLKQNSKFTIKNTDNTAHILVIDPERVYSISANSKIEIKVDFGKGPGIYGFGCDRSNKSVGIFQVIEQ